MEREISDIKDLISTYPDCLPSQVRGFPKTIRAKQKVLTDFKNIEPFLYKGLCPKSIADETGMSKSRISSIFLMFGKRYDQRLGRVYGNLKVVSKVTEGDANNTAVYKVVCDNCKQHPVYSKIEFTSTIERLNLGKTPCACNPSYELPTQELKKELIYSYTCNKDFTIHEVSGRSFAYSCHVCGTSSTMDKRSLKNSKRLACRCSDHFKHKTEDQELETVVSSLNNRKGNTLEVVEYLVESSRFIVTCSKCSVDTEMYPYGSLSLTRQEAVRGTIPCGCSQGYNNTQYKILVCRKLKDSNLILGDWDDTVKVTYETFVTISCPNHGDFKRRVGTILHTSKPSCIKCHPKHLRSVYQSSEKDVKTRLVENMTQQHTFLRFCEDFNNQNQKFTYYCADKGLTYTRSIRGFLDGSKGSCCSGGGFKKELSGYLYITCFEDLEGITLNKIGVSNNSPEKRNHEQNRRAGFKFDVKPLIYIFFEKGEDALLLEKVLTDLYQSGIVSSEVFPDGFTETILSRQEDLRDLWGDLLLMTGCSIFGEYTQVIVPKEEEHRLDFKGRHWLVNTTTLEKVKEDIWQ